MRIFFKIMICALVIMMIGAGCMGDNSSKSISQEEFLDMMREKYNEEFTITGGGDESWTASYSNIYLRSETYPDHRVKAIWNGEYIIDNYVYFLQRENVEATLREMFDPIYDDYKVFFNIGTPLSRINPEMTTEEFLESISKDGMGFDICVQDENYIDKKDVDLEKVKNALVEKGYAPGFGIVYMEPGRLSEVNRENLNELYTGATSEEWLVLRGDFALDDNFDYLYEGWREE